jgi:acylphosphatase
MIKMKLFKGIVSYVDSKTFVTDMNVQANGKEEAIEKIMNTIWKKDFTRYMRILKVEVKEIN